MGSADNGSGTRQLSRPAVWPEVTPHDTRRTMADFRRTPSEPKRAMLDGVLEPEEDSVSPGGLVLAAGVALIAFGLGGWMAGTVVLALYAYTVIVGMVIRRRDRRRGWRITGVGPEDILYCRWIDGKWRRIDFWSPLGDRVIHVGSRDDWKRYPEWAQRDRDAILSHLAHHYRGFTLDEQSTRDT